MSMRCCIFFKNGLNSLRGQWFSALLLLLPALASYGQVEVSAALDSASILIGDQVEVTVTIRLSPQISVDAVDWSVLQEDSTELEIVGGPRRDTIRTGAQLLLREAATLTAFDSGYYRLPPIPVRYRQNGAAQTTLTESLALEVRTYPIEEQDSLTVAPIKGIIEEPLLLRDFLPYLIGLLALALLVAGIITYRRSRRSRAPAAVAEPDRPPHEVALEKLAQLRGDAPWRRGALKAYYSELSFIVREYLENRYGLPALESTTAQLLGQLPGDAVLEDWQAPLRQLLQTADMVKFAKAHPPDPLHEELLAKAEALVHQTQSSEAEPPGKKGDEVAS